jgi:dipeptidyl aminopeptidase/acylaminoacyl peptidase
MTTRKSTKKKPFTVDELWKLDRLAAPALSPDGAQLVCSVTSYDMDENKGRSALWLLSTFGGEPRLLTTTGEKDGAPAWSPKGDAIAFLAKRTQEGRADEAPQLYRIAPDGGEARRASDFAPGIDAFKWFSDGRRIAFVAWVWPDAKGAKEQAKRVAEHRARKESAYVTDEAQYRWWDRNLPMGRVPHLHVLDTDTGTVVDLFEGTGFELQRHDPDAHSFDISPDGRHIVFAFDPSTEKRADHHKALAEIDLKTGRIAAVVQDADWDFETPRWSPDGTRIAFVASHQAKGPTMPGWLAVLERGGAWKVASDGWDRSVHAPLRWSADGAAVLFAAEDQGRQHLWRLELGEPKPALVARGGWVREFDLAGDTLTFLADSADFPARAYVLRGSAAPLRLERFNDKRLGALAIGRSEAVTIAGALGEPVQVWLTYPPGFDPKSAQKKWPLLHSIHGGPHTAAGDTWHWRWNTQVFAAQGYVVAGVNYHGSSSFGHAFQDSISGRWGALELQDVEAATDWLVKKRWIDRKRLFATGGSYGGFMVAWMNAKLPAGRYAATVCHAGCFDWVGMFAGDAYAGFPREIGAKYWEDMAKVHAQSPHAQLKTLATPTLVVHGALDFRVPDAQGLAYYNTLKAQGVPARLVWFPDENHWILKPRNNRLWYAEYFAWLAKHDPALRPLRQPRGARAAAA